MNKVRLLIVDDHPLVREGLRTLLRNSDRIDVVGDASDANQAVAKSMSLRPDVVLMDIQMPGKDGIEAVRAIHSITKTIKILMLTSQIVDGSVKKALRAGAIGYLLKDVSKLELEAAIVNAAKGQGTFHPEAHGQLIEDATKKSEPNPFDGLTRRESDVVRNLISGKSNKEIAIELNLTEGTVKGYISSALRKTGCIDRTQLALRATKFGFGQRD